MTIATIDGGGRVVVEYVQRCLDIRPLLRKRTVFLFGPRQSGKSTYIGHQLGDTVRLIVNLLDRAQYLELSADPTRLRQRVEAERLRNGVVVIDEVQKCPELLDEVQLMIEERGLRFLLTGSSARKLRRGGVNLLGGRGRDRHFHPFVYSEVKDFDFSLERAMHRGMIPNHYFSDDPDDDLRSYVGRYLAEEVAAEGLTRNVPAFARFLEVAATANAQLINYTSIGSDAQVARQTVQTYFQVLRDTLIGFDLPPFTRTVKRKPIETAKFYFFDLGVVRALRRLGRIVPGSSEFGEFFEHFIFLELRAYLDYFRQDATLAYWRSHSAFEVDFIVDGAIAIEAKAATNISDKHLKGLRALADEGLMKSLVCVCREPHKRKVGRITIYPWRDFLEALWAGEVL